MWYSSWVLDVSVAAAFAALNAMWLGNAMWLAFSPGEGLAD